MSSVVRSRSVAGLGAFDRVLRASLLRRLDALAGGGLVLRDALGRVELGQAEPAHPLVALQVNDARF